MFNNFLKTKWRPLLATWRSCHLLKEWGTSFRRSEAAWHVYGRWGCGLELEPRPICVDRRPHVLFTHLEMKPRPIHVDERPHFKLICSPTLSWPWPFQADTHFKLTHLFSICIIHLSKNTNFLINFQNSVF